MPCRGIPTQAMEVGLTLLNHLAMRLAQQKLSTYDMIHFSRHAPPNLQSHDARLLEVASEPAPLCTTS
eukprot:5531911-Amphidinium_carterae.1